jgi:hypothetical protein
MIVETKRIWKRAIIENENKRLRIFPPSKIESRAYRGFILQQLGHLIERPVALHPLFTKRFDLSDEPI